MSGSYGPADEEESVATLHHALDLGVDFIDTADSYGEDGHNESLIGRALKARRHEFVLATKTGWVKRAGTDGKSVAGVDGRPDRIRSACEASLARLKTDVIDLYYLHRVDPDVPVEESVGAMSELVAAGKVRFLGLSEVSENTLRSMSAFFKPRARIRRMNHIYYILDKWLERHPEMKKRERDIRISI